MHNKWDDTIKFSYSTISILTSNKFLRRKIQIKENMTKMNSKNCLIGRFYLHFRVVKINKFSIILKLSFILNIPQNPFFVNIYRGIIYIYITLPIYEPISFKTIYEWSYNSRIRDIIWDEFFLWDGLKNEVKKQQKSRSHIFGYSDKISKTESSNIQFFPRKKPSQ